VSSRIAILSAKTSATRRSSALSHPVLRRDFAYERRDCFRSVTARAINELFRSHAFVLAVNFHAGISLLGWPWGDSLHCNGGSSAGEDAECRGGGWDSGDSTAMRGLGERIARVAGGVAASSSSPALPAYKTGAINEASLAAAISRTARPRSAAGDLQRARWHRGLGVRGLVGAGAKRVRRRRRRQVSQGRPALDARRAPVDVWC
jgi:hypothetical protein